MSLKKNVGNVNTHTAEVTNLENSNGYGKYTSFISRAMSGCLVSEVLFDATPEEVFSTEEINTLIFSSSPARISARALPTSPTLSCKNAAASVTP